MKNNLDKFLATRIGRQEFKQFHKKAKQYGGASELLRLLITDFLTKDQPSTKEPQK